MRVARESENYVRGNRAAEAPGDRPRAHEVEEGSPGSPQRAKVEAARAAVKKVMGELTKIIGQRKDIEIELQDLEEDKAYYADKVTEIQESVSNGTYRDAQNFEAALATLAKRIEKAEFDSNALVGQLETVERAEKNAARSRTPSSRPRRRPRRIRSRRTWSPFESTFPSSPRSARELSLSTSAQNLAAYDTACKRFGGIAVETLVGNRPSVCRVALQPSSYTDIRRSNAEVTTCPYCKRMLVISKEDTIMTEGKSSRSRKVALFVTGGIASYKACEILRGLQKNGCDVRVAMTEAAHETRWPQDIRSPHRSRGLSRRIREFLSHSAHRAGRVGGYRPRRPGNRQRHGEDGLWHRR